MRPSINSLLRQHFPISRHLGVRIQEASPRRVILTAPLAPNKNRSGTAFAGSLNALATLAGWAWLTLHLRRPAIEAQVILQDATISYARPATGAFRAVCLAPEGAELDRFGAALHRRHRGRLRLTVDLETRKGPVAFFSGRYVAVIPRPASRRPT